MWSVSTTVHIRPSSEKKNVRMFLRFCVLTIVYESFMSSFHGFPYCQAKLLLDDYCYSSAFSNAQNPLTFSEYLQEFSLLHDIFESISNNEICQGHIVVIAPQTI